MIFKTAPYRVYVYDTDVAGVVHHSNYLRYFEAGRIEFFAGLGTFTLSFNTKGLGLCQLILIFITITHYVKMMSM